MNWESIKLKLEQILNAPLQLVKMTTAQWNEIVEGLPGEFYWDRSLVYNQTLFFYLYREGSFVYAFVVEEVLLTSVERQLVEMMLESFRSREKKPTVPTRSDEESLAVSLREWILQQVELGTEMKEIPDAIATHSGLHANKVPILLYGSYSDHRKTSYLELKKLLEQFFDSGIILIPLSDREWLILGSEALLTASGGEDKGSEGEETPEEALASICFGLYEMMAIEWVGECHLSIAHPVVPAKSLLSTVIQLREAILLGRTYHLGENIHLPWLMHLDRLLHLIPEDEKTKFMENVLKRIDYVLDSEMQHTLEHFFALDCNVSETAKKLYIHRNTLLYRLDKFKQETGFDVRSFKHAVLVKIAVSLYKVTKRK